MRICLTFMLICCVTFSSAIKYGPGVLSGIGAISSFIINNHFRYKLKLGTYGRFSSYLSVVVTPALFTALFHTTVSPAAFCLTSQFSFKPFSFTERPSQCVAEEIRLPDLFTNQRWSRADNVRRVLPLLPRSSGCFYVRNSSLHL